MRIIFESDDPCHGRLVFNTDWSFSKKILDLIWDDMTIESLKRIVEDEAKEKRISREFLEEQLKEDKKKRLKNK